MLVKIANEVNERFNQFIWGQTCAYPSYVAARFSKKLNVILSLVQLVVFLIGGVIANFILIFRQKKKFYIFEGDRFKEIHSLFPPSSVIIIGGIRDWRYARKKGYGFHWDGYIRKLFNINYYLNFSVSMLVLIIMVRSLLGRKLSGGSRLFVFEDTTQVGASLSLMLKDLTPVICIAHGYLLKANDGFFTVPDGNCCPYNFIYDNSQAEVLDSNSLCITMGLPYDIPVVSGWVEEIVLIEQSTPDLLEEYDDCLNKMIHLYSCLKEFGHKVIYRSRPGIDVRNLLDEFDIIDVGNKFDLLKGPRRVFVGFNSTLLYEAKVCGHVVVGLDDSAYPYGRRFDVDVRIENMDIDSIRMAIEYAFGILRSSKITTFHEPLADRFFRCLDQVEKNLIEKGNQAC